jgi:Na+/H+-dicarboxylate symporter
MAEVAHTPAGKNRITLYILIAMALGIFIGYLINIFVPEVAEVHTGKTNGSFLSGITREGVLQPFSLLADVFLRLVKMIIAPLVFSTLVVGVAKQGNINAVGRIGGKTMLWFITFSLISLVMGMLLVNTFLPGIAMHLPLPDAAGTTVAHASLSLKEFISHIFPTSIIDAMAKNEILQVVVFSLFFGVATAAVGEKGAIVITVLDSVAHIILKVTAYVMNFAPLAVLGAMTAVIGKQGLGILSTYSLFIGEFYLGLFLLFHL